MFTFTITTFIKLSLITNSETLLIRLLRKQIEKAASLHKTHRWNLWHDMYAHDGLKACERYERTAKKELPSRLGLRIQLCSFASAGMQHHGMKG